MTIAYTKFFAPTVLTTSAATLYTVPSAPSNILLRGGRVRCVNTSNGIQTVTLYAVPSAGSAAAGNAFASTVSIGPGQYQDFDVPIMAAGDFIQALASANTSVTIQAMAGGLFS